MADFCKQCSLDMWGQDSRDLALTEYKNSPKGTIRFYTICEGCGPTVVDPVTGTCIGDCLQRHGSLKVQTLAQSVKEELPS